MMPGSSSSLLTIAQNAVLAINGLSQQFQKFFKTKIIWSITDFGGIGDGVTDNAAAFAKAFAALTGTGGVIYFPPGKYVFKSQVSYNLPAGIFSVSIVGAGQDATILTWPGGSGGMSFNYAGISSSVHVRDLSLTTGTTNGGNALTLQNAVPNANPALTAISDICRVTIRGDDGYSATNYWSAGINVVNVSNIQYDNLTIVGAAAPNGNGINLVGLPASSTYSVVHNITKSTFLNLANCIVYGSFVQGVTIDQSNFVSNAGTSNGIAVPGSQTGTLAQLSITNCQFNLPSNSIVFGTTVNEVTIENNLFISRANSNALNLGNVSFFTIVGNVVQAFSVTGTNGIVIGGSGSIGTIGKNVVYGFGTGIWLQANAAVITVTGNTLFNNTTALLNQSTANSNYIAENPGYNPVGVTLNTMGASLFTYTAGSSPETHYVRSAGTISSITVGGQTIATAALANDPITIHLGPNESYVTMWATTAPTYVRSIH
jgi:hypothetical protein